MEQRARAGSNGLDQPGGRGIAHWLAWPPEAVRGEGAAMREPAGEVDVLAPVHQRCGPDAGDPEVELTAPATLGQVQQYWATVGSAVPSVLTMAQRFAL